MSATIYQMRRWVKMLQGKSIYHVNQGPGKIYSRNEIAGYYNDLTQKVLLGDGNLEEGLPFLEHSDGSHIQFPIMIFQYGLGAYDLWLLSGRRDQSMYKKFMLCAHWALEHQMATGAWSNFFYIYPKTPYSSMAQGEGISLVIRAYLETKEEKFADAAHRAAQFMLRPIAEGGTAEYCKNEVFLHEFTQKPVVLNGWIFSVFGLYDYCMTFENPEVKSVLDRTIKTMENHLQDYDTGYWSKYNCDKMITSPFYHNLHIAQMEGMYALTGAEIFRETGERWKRYQASRWNRMRSFIKKAMQKIMEH